jgi:hypothetical protein
MKVRDPNIGEATDRSGVPSKTNRRLPPETYAGQDIRRSKRPRNFSRLP